MTTPPAPPGAAGTGAGDTIAACATAPGSAAVALIRLSGPEAAAIAARLFDRPLPPRRAVHGEFRDEAGAPIDDGLAVLFPAPRSYTGETVVEFTPHGAPLIVRRLLEAALKLGARAARPGEFTYRAFVNGRLDAAQAEAVDALIRAETEAERVAARRALSGELAHRLAPLEAGLRELISRLEGAVEFVEERIDFTGGGAQLLAEVELSSSQLAALSGSLAAGRALAEDLAVTIVGPPNAGKSTLFNFLAGHEAAIVSAIPGTTRDLLRERIEVRGLKVRLTDTAGLREGGDEIEAIGIARAREAGGRAARRLLVLDGRDSVENREQLLHWPPTDTLVILNKGDLAPPEPGLLSALADGGYPHHATALGDANCHVDLQAAVESFIAPGDGGSDALAASPRALALTARAADALARARDLARAGASEELLLEELWDALRALGALTRPPDLDEIYDLIFSNFCIGK